MERSKAQELAIDYTGFRNGVRYRTPPKLIADPTRGHAIAREYLSAPAWSDAALTYFDQFAVEVGRQYRYLRRFMRHEITLCDPYADHLEMFNDISRNNRLATWSTAAGDTHHPYLTDEQNDQFRFIHDFFGHYTSGFGFDRHGEESAWYSHVQMFSPGAARAMTTETRGQNSAMIWGLDAKAFAEQKVILLSPEYSDISNVTVA